jgi:hypothetical protein
LDGSSRSSASAGTETSPSTSRPARRLGIMKRKRPNPIPHEEVLAEFGLSNAAWEKMSREP